MRRNSKVKKGAKRGTGRGYSVNKGSSSTVRKASTQKYFRKGMVL